MSFQATYVGPIAHLRGETAAIIDFMPHWWRGPKHAYSRLILAQFDNPRAQKRRGRRGYTGLSRRSHLGYGWHAFDTRDWRLTHTDVLELYDYQSACPSQFEGRLSNGLHFYARYRGGRVCIGFHPKGVTQAVAVAMDVKCGGYERRRRSVHPLDGYMTWSEMRGFMVKALARYESHRESEALRSCILQMAAEARATGTLHALDGVSHEA